MIALPKVEAVHQSTVLAGFATDLLSLFTASPVMGASSLATKNSHVEDPDDWADLDLESPKVVPTAKGKSGIAVKDDEGEDPIPEVSTLPRPEELTKRPPYWMVINQEGPMKVVIEASHAPSLACLDAYLRRWCRGEVSRVNRVSIIVKDFDIH